MKLVARLWLALPPREVFPFFTAAENLQAITPPWLDFSVLAAQPLPMQRGTIIDYRLRLHGVPFAWQSEITVWEPPHVFRDEQRRGPYRRWSHTHTFEDADGGTLCRDEVDYAVPGGAWVERWLVRRDLRRIFAHRQQALHAHFAAHAGARSSLSADPDWSVRFESTAA